MVTLIIVLASIIVTLALISKYRHKKPAKEYRIHQIEVFDEYLGYSSKPYHLYIPQRKYFIFWENCSDKYFETREAAEKELNKYIK